MNALDIVTQSQGEINTGLPIPNPSGHQGLSGKLFLNVNPSDRTLNILDIDVVMQNQGQPNPALPISNPSGGQGLPGEFYKS